MRNLLLLSCLLGVSAAWADDDAVTGAKVKVEYLGTGVYAFKGTNYGYAALLAAIRAKYAGSTLGLVSVEMGQIATERDKRAVCRLQQDLNARVKMHLTVGDEKRELFCN